MVDNLTISDYLDMQATDQQNYVRLKTHIMTIPNPAPILRIEQGILAFKDLNSLGYLATVSKTEIPFGSTYTNCVPSDIGKQVVDDGIPIPNIVLAGYDNNAKKWWLSGSTSIVSGSALTLADEGTGAGTSSGSSSVYGGGAIKIGHGLTGPTDPPKISLMDSEQGYDTLYIRKADGTTPAHLDLGNLTVHGDLRVDSIKKLDGSNYAFWNGGTVTNPVSLTYAGYGSLAVAGFTSSDNGSNSLPLWLSRSTTQFNGIVFRGAVAYDMGAYTRPSDDSIYIGEWAGSGSWNDLFKFDSSGNLTVGGAAYSGGNKSITICGPNSAGQVATVNLIDGNGYLRSVYGGNVELAAYNSLGFFTNHDYSAPKMTLDTSGNLTAAGWVHPSNSAWGMLVSGDVMYLGKSGVTNGISIGTSGNAIVAGGLTVGAGVHLNSTGGDNFQLFTNTNTPNPNWAIGYGNGSGSIDTSKEYISSNAGVITFMNAGITVAGVSTFQKTGASAFVVYGQADFCDAVNLQKTITFNQGSGKYAYMIWVNNYVVSLLANDNGAGIPYTYSYGGNTYYWGAMNVGALFTHYLQELSSSVGIQVGGKLNSNVNGAGYASYNGGGGGGNSGGICLDSYGNACFVGGSSGNYWSVSQSVGGSPILSVGYSNWVSVLSLSGTGTRAVYSASNGVLTNSSSSIRYKENIRDYSDASWIYALRPVMFDWKDHRDANNQIGLIAEEVYAVNPVLAFTDQNGIPEGVHYERLGIPLLVEVQKHDKHIGELEAQIHDLRSQIEALNLKGGVN